MGDVGGAESLYKSALKRKEPNARAYLELYRIYHAASLYRSARMMCLRAITPIRMMR